MKKQTSCAGHVAILLLCFVILLFSVSSAERMAFYCGDLKTLHLLKKMQRRIRHQKKSAEKYREAVRKNNYTAHVQASCGKSRMQAKSLSSIFF